jgi:tetratricopeptide (TPR) repeat protein
MTPSSIHQLAIELREQGQSEPALTQYDQALADYQRTNNQEGIIRCYLEKAIVCRHLYKKTQISSYLDSAEQLIALAEAADTNQSFSQLILEQRGSLIMAGEEWASAQQIYQQLLDLAQLTNDQRGNYFAHLGWATFMLGERETGQQQLAEGIDLLRSSTAPSVDAATYRVWLSGAWLNLARCQLLTQPDEVAATLATAHDIITQPTLLPLRAQEWRSLHDQMNAQHA